MNRHIAAGLLALTALLPARASAAMIEAKECADHSKGCYIITVNGDIDKDDGKKFVDLVEARGVTNGMVALNGWGGELFAGLKIAYAVHEKKFHDLGGRRLAVRVHVRRRVDGRVHALLREQGQDRLPRRV